MTHYSYEEWMRYVKNELSEENQGVYENHLYSCDQCLDLYLQAVSEEESRLPLLANESIFTDLVMEQVAEIKLPKGQSSKGKVNEKKEILSIITLSLYHCNSNDHSFNDNGRISVAYTVC